MRQPPGERNALGRIKFMFPNDYAVYLHDTPPRALFDEDKRAFSHGCVRVDDPFRFAETVLGPGWSEDRIKKLIGGKERYVNLAQAAADPYRIFHRRGRRFRPPAAARRYLRLFAQGAGGAGARGLATAARAITWACAQALAATRLKWAGDKATGVAASRLVSPVAIFVDDRRLFAIYLWF